MKKNKTNVDTQLTDTNSMLTKSETNYNDVYGRIQELIKSTGTEVGTEAEESMEKMKETITPALETIEKGIDEWIERNKNKGFTIKTELIKTGNESKDFTTNLRQDTELEKKPSVKKGTSSSSSNTNNSSSGKSSSSTKKTTSTKTSGGSSSINNDPVRKIILELSDRSVIASADEKKKHSELWAHIV